MNLTNYLPDYLVSPQQMEIEDEENVLIFGANGIGKSSIYENLSQDDNFHSIDYDDMLNDFKKSKKKAHIAANLVRIEELKNEIDSKVTEQQIKKNLKIFGITTQGQCFGELLEIYKNAKVETVLPANEATFQQLNDINGELGSEFASILKSILENRASLDLAYEITLLKQDLQNKFLEIGNNMLTSNSTECPFCGSEIIDIKQQIERRMADLQIAEEYIISQFKNINIHEKRAEEIIENIAIIPIGEIIGYLVSGGNFEQLQTINRSVQEIESKEYEKSQLHDEQVRVYRRLRNYEDNINRDLNGKFNDIEINFNDETNCIDITFPRNVDTYSNGEVNYLMFNIKLYEFIGSDKTKLIIDDILNIK